MVTQVEPEKPFKKFLKLPYINKNGEYFAQKFKKVVNEYFPQVDFNIAFQAPMTISKLFPFKDKNKNVEDRSLVVFSMKCKTCEAEYIGKLERILSYVRINKHQNLKTI